MPQTGIVRDIRYLDHMANGYHPESHERLEVLNGMLQEPGMKENYVEIKPRMATQGELELIHVPAYIRMVASTAGYAMTMLDPDTYACSKSYETARLAAGGTLSGIGFNGTWNGTTNAIPTAFSLNGTACTVN